MRDPKKRMPLCNGAVSYTHLTAIPQYFYESLSRRVLENGLVARCIIVEAGKRGEAGNPQPITPSDSLIRAATYLANLDVNGNLTNEYPKPLIITETPEATAALREVQQECDRRYNFYEMCIRDSP